MVLVLELEDISDTIASEDIFEYALLQLLSPSPSQDPDAAAIANNIFYNFNYDGLHDFFLIAKAPFDNPNVALPGLAWNVGQEPYRVGDIVDFRDGSTSPVYYKAQDNIAQGTLTFPNEAGNILWNELGAPWDLSEDYTTGDIVVDQNVTYTANTDIPASSNDPTSDPNEVWALREGIYDSAIDYRIGDVVTFNSENWISIEDIHQTWNTEQDYVSGDTVVYVESGQPDRYYEAVTPTLSAFQWDIDTPSYAAGIIVFDGSSDVEQWFESQEIITAPTDWNINATYSTGDRVNFPANSNNYYIALQPTIDYPDYIFRQDYIFDAANPTIVNFPETTGGDNRYFELEADFIFPDDWVQTTVYPAFGLGLVQTRVRSNDPLGTGVLTLDDFSALQTGSTITITDGTTPITVTAAAVAGLNQFTIGQDNEGTANNIATAFNDAFFCCQFRYIHRSFRELYCT